MPANVYEYVQRSEDPLYLWVLPTSLMIINEGDIILFRDESTAKTIATVMVKLEDEQILEELSQNSRGDSAGYLLRDMQEVEFDMDANEIWTPDSRIADYIKRADSEEYGIGGGFGMVLSQFGGHLERRRMYRLFGATKSSGAGLIESLIDTLESAVVSVFGWISGGRVLRISGFFTLLLLFGVGVVSEVVCWLTMVGELLGFTSVTCVHLFSLPFIGPATELSFALTGFLFVGVAVVAVIAGQAEDQPAQTAEITISTLGTTPDTEDVYELGEGMIELYEGGGMLDDDWVNWILEVRSSDSLQVYRTQKKPIEPPDGSYVIWNSLTGPTPTDGRAWHLSGDISGQNIDEFPDWLLGSERGISWWIVDDQEPRLAAFRAKVRRATGYAVSASVLGVVIGSLPWQVDINQNPWLGALPIHQHVLYGLLTIAFTYVFIGMAWTSIGLLEFIREIRT